MVEQKEGDQAVQVKGSVKFQNSIREPTKKTIGYQMYYLFLYFSHQPLSNESLWRAGQNEVIIFLRNVYGDSHSSRLIPS